MHRSDALFRCGLSLCSLLFLLAAGSALGQDNKPVQTETSGEGEKTVPSSTSDNQSTREQKLRKGLMGVWKLDAGTNQGRPLTKEEIDGTTVVVKDLAIITYDKDQRERYRASYILNASADPIEITMTAEIDGKSPRKSLGIVKTSGGGAEERINRWTLCYALPGHPRPKSFENERGSSVMKFRMKRAEPSQN